MRQIGTIDWLYRWNAPSLALDKEMDNADEAVLYGSDESLESTAMVALLNELGVQFEYRRGGRRPTAPRRRGERAGGRGALPRGGGDALKNGLPLGDGGTPSRPVGC